MMSNRSASAKPHVIPLKTYLAVGFALMVLTGITVTVSFINLGGWNAIIAVGIASVKASLVAFIFMHLLYDKKIFLVIFIVAITFLTIFIALTTMFDTVSRGQINFESDKPIEYRAKMYNNIKPDTSSVEKDSLSIKPNNTQ